MKDKNKIWLTILKLVISIALLSYLAATANVEQIWLNLKQFDFIWLIPVFGAIALSVAVSALKWGLLLKAQGIVISHLNLFRYYTCGLFFNNFLPSSIGGDGVRVILAGRESGSYTAATSSVIMERILATITLALLGLASALFSRQPDSKAVLLLSILFIAGVTLAAIQLTGWIPKPLKSSQNKLAVAYKSFANSSAAIRKKPRLLVYCLLESLLFQIMVAFVIAAVMGGIGLKQLNIADLFLVTSASSVLAMVPIGINGYGLREGAYIYLLQPFGYMPAQAITVSVLFALFTSIYSLLGGIFWLQSHPAKTAKSENISYADYAGNTVAAK